MDKYLIVPKGNDFSFHNIAELKIKDTKNIHTPTPLKRGSILLRYNNHHLTTSRLIQEQDDTDNKKFLFMQVGEK